MLIAAGPAFAQGIDCAKPRGAVERGICASPRLLEQDADMARAFSRAMADPAAAASVRSAQIAWIRAREAACGRLADARALEACLTRFGTDRLAQLAPPKAAPSPLAPVATPAPVAAATAATPADSLVAPAPPPVVVPAPAATLDRASIPAAEAMETLLHVTQPGRFAIMAKSATGVALQLVDMLTGPSETMGLAGQTDGRIDALLDVGTYKLRAFAAPGASGDVQLSVTPFRDAAEAAGMPVQGRLDADLGDFQQRRFWLNVTEGESPRIEAAGRALADLRLFRDGTDLVDSDRQNAIIEPTAGHPLTDIVLSGELEPGVYELVAYGGRALAWPDGTPGQPFHLRGGVSEALSGGWVSGRIGPMGSEVFRTAPRTGALRLDLPLPAAVTLRVQGGLGASIAKNTREPIARLDLPAGGQVVTLRGAEGQPYRLRALDRTTTARLAAPGSFWTGLSAPGFGGDEPPASALLLRNVVGEPDPYVAGSVGIRVGPGLGWRQRFNLRGPLAILLDVTAATTIVARAEGVAAQVAIVPLGMSGQPRADGAAPTSWNLAAGWYALSVTPARNASGILDLGVGPADAIPAAPMPAGLPDPEPSFGLVTPAPREAFSIYSGSETGGLIGLVARPAPIDLAAGPLGVTLAAGTTLDLPVRAPADGNLVASEIGAGPLAAPFESVDGPTAGRIGMVHIAPSDHERTVSIGWRAPVAAPPVPPPPPPEARATLVAGKAQGFDLDRDTSRGFALDVPEGGLYRLETLGRMRTAATLGTAFLPDLDQAEANGIGRNMLIQRFLRAGRYRLTVTAKDSDGHLAVAARPAVAASGATLVPGGRVRARMAADSGVVFPVEIAARGTYHLDLPSLGSAFTARLEDAEGWPILPAGDLSSLDQELLPGHYRLLVQPTGVAARVVARLAPVTPDVRREGHGPFPLAFGASPTFTWREPAGRDDPRVPDVWTFALAGPAAVKLTIGDGMVADLRGPGGASVARLTFNAPFSGTLPAGAYRIEATSLGRNDRLDYAIALSSPALQPDVPRDVKLPATVGFAVARERVVSLTSFGSIPVRAVLRRADGTVIGRFGERGDDWNIAVARRLPAGTYTLDLSSAAPPHSVGVARTDPVRGGNASGQGDQSDSAGDDTGDTMTDQGPTPRDSATPDSSDDTAGNDTDRGASPSGQTVELRLALPPERPPGSLAEGGTALLGDGGVHVLALPPAVRGQLLLAAASSSAELALALEHRDGDGGWRTVAVRQGNAPVVGVPGDGAAWRVSVWTVDGGAEPVRVSARAVDAAPQPVGSVTVAAAGLPEFPSIAVARLSVPGSAPVRITGGAISLQAASGPGRALQPTDGGMVVPQTDDVWLLSMGGAAPVRVTRVDAPSDQQLALAIPESGDAMLPGAPVASGRVRTWIARSGLGQPGLDAGRGMGVAEGSALALGGEGAVRLFDAGGDDALRLLVTARDLATRTPRALDGPFSGVLPPGTALPVRLPEGAHLVRLDLAANTAAVADWGGRGAITEWAGDAAISRSVEGRFTEILLLNTGAQPAPVTLSWTPVSEPESALAAGTAFKRFFGAAGSLDMPVDAAGRLMVAGGQATLIGPAGHVARGTALALTGAGRVVIDHGPGLLAAWVEGPDGASPWPSPPPLAVTLPARMAMRDAAMTLNVEASAPMLLHARSTAPVILALGDGAPLMFPAGAEFHRALPAGPVMLRVISPHDGPLSGTLELDGEPIAPASEGVGAEVAVAPGGSAAFGFEVSKAGPVGVGVRADPDRLSVRLLGADGTMLGDGVAQLHRLMPGRYVLEASVPADGATTVLRPAIVGIARRPNGPPPDVVNMYLALAGRAPVAVAPVSAR
jgi:uncharacterized protein